MSEIKLFSKERIKKAFNKVMDKTEGKLIPVGSWRRKIRENIKDLDFLTTTPLYKIAKMLKMADADNIAKERKRLRVVVKKVPIDIFHTTEELMPFAKLHFTGNRDFNIIIRHHAKKRGFKLSQYGIFYVQNGNPVNSEFKHEKDIFEFLGFEYHKPEDRNKTLNKS